MKLIFFFNVNWLRLCVMLTLLRENQFQQTKDMQLPRFSAILMLWLKNHGNFCSLFLFVYLFCIFFIGDTVNLLLNLVTGMVLSRNTPYCRRMLNGLLAGPSVVILGLRFYLSSLYLHCNSSIYCNFFWFCYLLHWWKIFLMVCLCLEVTNNHTLHVFLCQVLSNSSTGHIITILSYFLLFW